MPHDPGFGVLAVALTGIALGILDYLAWVRARDTILRYLPSLLTIAYYIAFAVSKPPAIKAVLAGVPFPLADGARGLLIALAVLLAGIAIVRDRRGGKA